MNRIRVMLADDNRSILQVLSDYLSKKTEIEIVATVTDGSAIVETVLDRSPDVLVMDIIMPRKDGFMALEEMNRLEESLRPKIVVLTGLSRDDFIMRAIGLGASYYMVKPFDMHALYNRILEIAEEDPCMVACPIGEVSSAGESIDEQITNLFLTIGIPAHIKGYQYLREAVRMVMENGDVINRITKELYPGIAHKFDTTASKVERAMRHAIEVAWTRGRLDTVNQMYGHRVFEQDDKPTNGEFISCVCEKIRVIKSAV
ncbi:MAG: sporulation transcription factor Spo0A [Christensenellales bacterium]|nr:sporulation transcription factor Spo0A [Christensenellales bacterium]